jgi:hypothetical protein
MHKKLSFQLANCIDTGLSAGATALSPRRLWPSHGQTGKMAAQASGWVTTNALLVRRSRTGSCFSPRQQEAAPDGEEQT